MESPCNDAIPYTLYADIEAYTQRHDEGQYGSHDNKKDMILRIYIHRWSHECFRSKHMV
jgi:hypothetical protein